MATDTRRLRPGELCRLLNSTPLGEVISERQLRRHRIQAGLRIGDARHVDLVRYVAWLVHVRHAPQSQVGGPTLPEVHLEEAAQGAAAVGSRWKQVEGHGQKLSDKQEMLIAALLTEPTHAAAAAKAGVSPATVSRWLNLPGFHAAYQQARRALVDGALGRLQAATGQAVETLVAVARQGRRDSDRVRAAVALLEHALRGLAHADLLQGEPLADGEAAPLEIGEVVRILAARLRLLERSQLTTAEKARLSATLAEAWLRALGVEVIDKRLEALQGILVERQEATR